MGGKSYDDPRPAPGDEGRTPLRCECGQQLQINYIQSYRGVPLFEDGIRDVDLNRSTSGYGWTQSDFACCSCGKAYFLDYDGRTGRAKNLRLGAQLDRPLGHWGEDFLEDEDEVYDEG
jgi:hypothetical protein